jgi:hypothetical protein
MRRFYYLAKDLDRVDQATRALRQAGFERHQLHVLSLDDEGVARRPDLNGVVSLMKRDLIGSGVRGALVGTALVALVLTAAWLLGGLASPVGRVVTLFGAVAAFGFCVWEGGFYGIQTHNRMIRKFEKALRRGEHVVFIDADEAQRNLLDRELSQYPDVAAAGSTRGIPKWLLVGRREVPRFLTETMP